MFDSGIVSLIEALEKATSERAKTLQKHPRNSLVQVINDLRQEFDEVLDETQSNLTKEYATRFEKAENDIETGKEHLKRLQNAVCKLRDNAGPLSKLELDIQLKKAWCKAEDWLKSDFDHSVAFNAAGVLDHYKSSLSSDRIIRMVQSDVAPYTVKDKRSYNIKTKNDIYECMITGVCVLPDGKIAIVDQMNINIKLLDRASFVTDVFNLKPRVQEVYDISYVSDNKLACTCTLSKQSKHCVQFIEIKDDKINEGNIIELKYHCCGIEIVEDNMYVSSQYAIDVYTTNGKFVQRLYEVNGDEEEIERVAVLSDKENLLVTSKNNIVLLIDKTGKTLVRRTRADIDWPCGVCVAENNTFIVCGCASNSIVQFNETGKVKLATLVEDDDMIRYPKSVAFDSEHTRLIVGQISNNLVCLNLTVSS